MEDKLDDSISGDAPIGVREAFGEEAPVAGASGRGFSIFGGGAAAETKPKFLHPVLARLDGIFPLVSALVY